jgi:hypothetical protein
MKPKNNQITINPDEIVVRLDRSEAIAIPRSGLRTRVRLLDCIYSLIGRPGVTLRHVRDLISAVFRLHGWALPPAVSSTPP